MQALALALSSAGLHTPPARIRSVISDVDGTLFPFGTNPKLSDRNAKALNACSDNDVHISLATGRIPGPWCEGIKARLPRLGPCVFSNGALVLSADGTVLHETALKPETVAAVVAHTRGGRAAGAGRLAVLACTRWEAADPSYGSLRYLELAPGGRPTFCTDLISSAGEPDCVLLPAFELEGRSVLKFVIFTRTDSEEWAPMGPTVAALRAAGVPVLDCGPKQCEVLPDDVNKGTGVAKMLESIGVPLEATLACGDAENDCEMLRMVGVGVAMGNAKPEAREAADVVVGTNDEDGVAEAIERFVLSSSV